MERINFTLLQKSYFYELLQLNCDAGTDRRLLPYDDSLRCQLNLSSLHITWNIVSNYCFFQCICRGISDSAHPRCCKWSIPKIQQPDKLPDRWVQAYRVSILWFLQYIQHLSQQERNLYLVDEQSHWSLSVHWPPYDPIRLSKRTRFLYKQYQYICT